MKKFKFSLDTVLSYKQQALGAVQAEHAEILAQVHAQEQLLEECWREYRAYNEAYRQRSEQGMPITDALICQSNLRAMEREIQQETEKLEQLRIQEDQKREEVVEAKKETSSIEKLKDKKRSAYEKALAKSEELLIEEFVSTSRVIASVSDAAF